MSKHIVKIHFEGDIFRVQCVSAAEVLERVRKTVPSEAVLHYLDDEGDLIRFSSVLEVEEALTMVPSGAALRVYARLPGGAMPKVAQPQPQAERKAPKSGGERGGTCPMGSGAGSLPFDLAGLAQMFLGGSPPPSTGPTTDERCCAGMDMSKLAALAASVPQVLSHPTVQQAIPEVLEMLRAGMEDNAEDAAEVAEEEDGAAFDTQGCLDTLQAMGFGDVSRDELVALLIQHHGNMRAVVTALVARSGSQ